MEQVRLGSPIGALYILASNEAIHGLYFKPQIHLPVVQKLNRMHERARAQLQEYFAGARTDFDLPLNFGGTDFQIRVWQELAKIPYGQTISYSELARRACNPRAVRAAGSANGKNPISIIIPCHRVIAFNGKLGGYAGGLNNKTLLLTLEKAWPADGAARGAP